ncbi:ribosome recycling factor [Deferribacter thermophilus]|uniref:ribosome recycling factor n=1 Tax=Deferribacter thermophilus TaxID=53573 RepID=UPI003C25B4C6
MLNEIFEEVKKKMEKSVEYYKEELKGVRTGRASAALFENIKVDYYGTPTPIPQVATIQVPDPRLITIQPWEPNMVPVIEKAIMNSGLGLNPSNDGKLIRVPIPPLTEERRKELVKLVNKMAEEARVAIRNERRYGNEKVKKLEKDKEISEDEAKRALDKIQEMTNEYIKKIDEITEKKEKEIMEI